MAKPTQPTPSALEIAAWFDRYGQLELLLREQPDAESAWGWRVRYRILAYLLKRYGHDVTLRELRDLPRPTATDYELPPPGNRDVNHAAGTDVAEPGQSALRDQSAFRAKLDDLQKMNEQRHKEAARKRPLPRRPIQPLHPMPTDPGDHAATRPAVSIEKIRQWMADETDSLKAVVGSSAFITDDEVLEILNEATEGPARVSSKPTPVDELTFVSANEHQLSEHVKNQLPRLLGTCFPGYHRDQSYYKQLPQTRILATDRSSLIGHLGVDCRVIRVADAILSVFGIIDLCVRPDRRSAGIATTLLQIADSMARESGQDFIILMADRYDLYLSQGFQRVDPALTKWLGIEDHRTVGIIERDLGNCFMAKQLESKPWPDGEIDLLGYLF